MQKKLVQSRNPSSSLKKIHSSVSEDECRPVHIGKRFGSIMALAEGPDLDDEVSRSSSHLVKDDGAGATDPKTYQARVHLKYAFEAHRPCV